MKLKNNLTIKINKNEINFAQTLRCGQIFSYIEKSDKEFELYSVDKMATIIEQTSEYLFTCNESDLTYWKRFLDLDTDYDRIKTTLKKEKFLAQPIAFGSGIRILKQDILETIISFAISANNNIKRITKILFDLRKKYGTDMGNFFTFPTLTQLSHITEQNFREIGAGYRSPQLVKLIKELQNLDFEKMRNLDTNTLKNELIKLSGVGPKVCDCILLFAFSKGDVFPVDTWIEQCYNEYFEKTTNRIYIRTKLVEKFKHLSGYAQQYLFYFQRSKIKEK